MLVTSEIAEDLTYYFATSEQTPSAVGLGVLMNKENTVRQAGGFIIQLMPGYTEDVVVMLENNLEGVCSVTDMLEQGMTPNDMLNYLLRDLDYEELEVRSSEFYCGCNEERALRCVAALGADDIRDMVETAETAEVYCHFCGRRHYITPDVLAKVLEDSE